MDAETKIARYGNSLTVRLPAAMTRALDFREGDRVVLRETQEGVLIERPRRSRLAAMLATVQKPEPEWGAGIALGAEAEE